MSKLHKSSYVMLQDERRIKAILGLRNMPFHILFKNQSSISALKISISFMSALTRHILRRRSHFNGFTNLPLGNLTIGTLLPTSACGPFYPALCHSEHRELKTSKELH